MNTATKDPQGGHASPALAVSAWQNSLNGLVQGAERFVPEPVSVASCRITSDQHGRYKLLEGPPLTVRPDSKSCRPSKFASIPEKGEAALESFFSRGAAWERLTDSAVWEAGLAFGAEAKLDGRATRQLSEVILFGLAVRSGATGLTLSDVSAAVYRATAGIENSHAPARATDGGG